MPRSSLYLLLISRIHLSPKLSHSHKKISNLRKILRNNLQMLRFLTISIIRLVRKAIAIYMFCSKKKRILLRVIWSRILCLIRDTKLSPRNMWIVKPNILLTVINVVKLIMLVGDLAGYSLKLLSSRIKLTKQTKIATMMNLLLKMPQNSVMLLRNLF